MQSVNGYNNYLLIKTSYVQDCLLVKKQNKNNIRYEGNIVNLQIYSLEVIQHRERKTQAPIIRLFITPTIISAAKN